MSRGVKLVADTLIGGCSTEEYDLIALPVRPGRLHYTSLHSSIDCPYNSLFSHASPVISTRQAFACRYGTNTTRKQDMFLATRKKIYHHACSSA